MCNEGWSFVRMKGSVTAIGDNFHNIRRETPRFSFEYP